MNINILFLYLFTFYTLTDADEFPQEFKHANKITLYKKK